MTATPLDTRALRDAFGRFMTGVTVVTTRANDGGLLGFTANSFTSVSLDPPLLLVCPAKTLSCYAAFAECRHFAVNILAEGQESVSNIFAGYKGDRFAQVDHRLDPQGVPLINGAVATFSCDAHQLVDAGDHAVLMGRITDVSANHQRGLGYASGQYFSLGLERAARSPKTRRNVCGAIAQFGDVVYLEPTENGYRPPQLDLPNRQTMIQGLSETLARRGLRAEIGPVYSVFDAVEQDTHFAYLLASVTAPPEAPAGLVPVPVAQLPDTDFASPAIATMMRRYAEEATTRAFTFYLGDAEKGETHAFSQKG